MIINVPLVYFRSESLDQDDVIFSYMNISLHVIEFYTAVVCEWLVVIVVKKEQHTVSDSKHYRRCQKYSQIKYHCKMKNKCMVIVIQRQHSFV